MKKTTQNHYSLFKGLILRTCIITIIYFCNYKVFSQTTHNINNPSELTAAFSLTLNPGDIVILANGTYSNSVTMKVNGVGNAANPITYKAATPGGVTFTAGQTMDIGGEWCIVEGFRWKGGNGTSNFIEFRDGNTNPANNSTLKNCVVDGVTVSGGINPLNGTSVKHNWVVIYGTYNTVINCSFMNKITSGNFILGEYEFNAADGRCIEVGHKILNNYFYNYPKIDAAATNSGDSEAIRIGTSEFQNVQSNALVQNNYFVQADGENEIITNKSKGNSYINNTFRRCRGSLVMRHGSHTTVNGNYFLGENVEGTGGIRIVDSYQTVRNNYIQNCTNVADQAQWNNGITFLGGGDANAVLCTAGGNVTNGYQKVTNLNLSNNTFVNTEAPLFYNLATGSTDPLGAVNNNIFYFAPGNANITPVISGNATTDYANLGTALTYSGNEYKGTTLGVGVTNAGFAENTGITATPSGEIFTFTGGTTGVGADMGSYTPTTDGMVGYGIGACFVNNLGASITDGDCNVVIPESLIVGGLTQFTDVAGSKDVSVTANVSWSATTSDIWITTITPNSGTGDATVSISVTANTGVERNGTIIFTQTSGTSNIERTLNVSQAAPPPPDPRDGLIKINPNASDVEAIAACHEEIPPNHTKTNPKEHSLDKDLETLWAGSAALGTCVDDRVFIIYDLKGAFDLELVDIATTDGKTYNLQIWVSSTGTADGDFTNPFPAGDLLSNSDASFKAFVLPSPALATKYVKLIGNGQPAGSRYTSIHEIEFYGNTSTLSVKENQLNNQLKMFPNPVKDILTLSQLKTPISALQVFTIDGRKVMEKPLKNLESELKLDVSSFANGTYILHIINADASKHSKMFIVSH